MSFATEDASTLTYPAVFVRCLDCGTSEIVYDARTPEDTENWQALHECERTCLLCHEPFPEADKAYGLLVCSPCRECSPEEASSAVKEYAHTAPASEVTAYFQRTVELANARAAQDGAA